jgi:hypothetical protein
MANYMRNTLRVVEGDPQEVFGAVRSERSVIDFQQLIPMPANIMNSTEEVEWHGMKLPEWEAWAIEQWGTTKNACDARYIESNVIGFDTPWCEPEPIFEALAKRFPGHHMIVISDYLDWGVEEYEVYRIKNGSVSSEGRKQYSYVGEGDQTEEKA